MKRIKNIIALAIAVILVTANVSAVFAGSSQTNNNVTVSAEDIKTKKNNNKISIADCIDFTAPNGYYVKSIKNIVSDNTSVVVVDKNGRLTKSDYGKANITCDVIVNKESGFIFTYKDEYFATFKVSFTVYVSDFVSEHLDFDKEGKYVEDVQIDGVSQPGYPKEYDIVIESLKGKINGGEEFSFGSNDVNNDKDEYRTYKYSMISEDSIEITAEYKKGHYEKKRVEDYFGPFHTGHHYETVFVDDFNGEVFEYTKVYSGDELKKAKDNCDSGVGYDFNLNFTEVSNQETNTVTVHYYKAGTTTKLFEDVVIKALPGYMSEVTIPVLTEDKAGIEKDHYTVSSEDVSVEKGKFDVTVGEEDKEITVYYTPEGKFSVTFLDENGEVLKSSYVYKGQKVEAPKETPKKADEIINGNKETETAGTMTKFAFDSWVAESENAQYTIADIENVTQNMIFRPAFKSSPVRVRFHVLNAGLEQPSEINSYPVNNYSAVQYGTIYEFKEIKNEKDVAANIAKAPGITSFDIKDKDGNNYVLKEGQSIKWYVLKKEKDGYHVDGIITNQAYNLTVKYVADTDNDGVAEEIYKDVTKVNAGAEYSIHKEDIEGYTFKEGQKELYEGTMPYSDIEIVFEYEINEYTVKYLVNEEKFKEFKALYGAVINIDDVVYTPESGYSFSGWSTDKLTELKEGIKSDIIIRGTTTKVPTTTEAETTTEEVVTTTETETITEEVPTTTETETTTEEVVTTTEAATTEEEVIITTENPFDGGSKEQETTTESEEEIDIPGQENPYDGGEPTTGDNTNAIVFIIALLSALGVAIAGVTLKKNNK